MPRTAQRRAKIAGPKIIVFGTSAACSDSLDLGSAKKTVPKALTKQAAAKALVSANRDNERSKKPFSSGNGIEPSWKNAWNSISSLTNPLNGGSAEIDTAPIKKSIAV